MTPLLGVLALFYSWLFVVDDTHVAAQVVLPAQLFVSSGSNTTAVALSHTCNASIEFYDESALTCSQCVTANGASTLLNPLLVRSVLDALVQFVTKGCFLHVLRFQITIHESLGYRPLARASKNTNGSICSSHHGGSDVRC